MTNIVTLDEHLPPKYIYDSADQEERVRILQDALVDFAKMATNAVPNAGLNLKVNWRSVIDNFSTVYDSLRLRGLVFDCPHEIRVMAVDASYQMETRLMKHEITQLKLQVATLQKEVATLKAEKESKDEDV